MLFFLTPHNFSLPLTKIPKIVILHLWREKEHFRTVEFNILSDILGLESGSANRLLQHHQGDPWSNLAEKLESKFDSVK